MSGSITYGVEPPPTVNGLPRGATDRAYQGYVEYPPGSGQVATAIAQRGAPDPWALIDAIKALTAEIQQARLGAAFALDPAGADVSELLKELPTE